LQRDGEAATAPASAAGIRVVCLCIPAVLGGATIWRNMGPVGSGRQWSSWVSRDELASIVHHVLVTDALAGPVNPVSPNPVRNDNPP
jgi:NAD dependent epimerase/dehydratase family enzyme